MIPLWLFLLGNRMSPETRRYRIPYVGIVLSLLGIMAPLAAGMALKKKKPDWATRLAKHLKTITIMVLCLLIIFTAAVNYYIFMLLTWRTLACVALISWNAYLFGGLAALVGRLERKQIIAVAIEVAFQNSAIAVIIIYTALPLPDADIMISPVAGQAILQGVPLYLLFSALAVRRRLGALTGATDDTSAAKPLPVPAPAEDAKTSGATDSPKAPVSPPSSQPLEQLKEPSQEGLSPEGVAELEEVMSGPPGTVHVLWDTLTAFQGEQLDFAGIARSGPESVQRVSESHGADADREEAASKSTAPAKEAAKLDETAGRPETTKSPPLAVHPPASANGAPC